MTGTSTRTPQGGVISPIHFYWPWEWNFFGLNKKQHAHHHNSSIHGKKSKGVEFELPPHMATGFALSLAGALICIIPIPGIQLVGAEMIFAGGVLFLEGLASGEKPYYIDSQTGKIVDVGIYSLDEGINN